jgi:hypothetical protein
VLLQENHASEDTIELTAVSVNHTGHEDAESEEPPPLPPPRGESLGRSHFTETESSPTNNHGIQIMYYKQTGIEFWLVSCASRYGLFDISGLCSTRDGRRFYF